MQVGHQDLTAYKHFQIYRYMYHIINGANNYHTLETSTAATWLTRCITLGSDTTSEWWACSNGCRKDPQFEIYSHSFYRKTVERSLRMGMSGLLMERCNLHLLTTMLSDQLRYNSTLNRITVRFAVRQVTCNQERGGSNANSVDEDICWRSLQGRVVFRQHEVPAQPHWVIPVAVGKADRGCKNEEDRNRYGVAHLSSNKNPYDVKSICESCRGADWGLGLSVAVGRTLVGQLWAKVR